MKKPAPDKHCITTGDGGCVGSGCVHDDNPLSPLEERLLRQVLVDGFNFRSAILRDRSPRGQEIYHMIEHPRLGDLVFETSSGAGLYQQGDIVVARTHRRAWARPDEQLGILREHGRRPRDIPDWEVEKDGPIPDEEYWVIERLTDQGMTTWTNAHFARIPEGWQ